MQASFLSHARFRHLKLALLLVAASIAAYAWQDPIGGPSGGSWVGYGLGGVGAAIILLLLWYGVRKRRFHSRLGTVRGWLSAHVYLGLALVVVATLHAAFQFGWNIHTVAYGLMLAVIASGLYGTYVYRRYPALMTDNRAGTSPAKMLDELATLEQQAVELADKIDNKTHQVVLRSIGASRIGGGVWSQLRGVRPRRVEREDARAEAFLADKNETLIKDLEKLQAQEDQQIRNSESTMMFVAGQMAQAEPGQQVERMRQLMDLLARRRALVRKLSRDIQQRARLQVWLYLHVPLSIGLLAALIAHIVSVFTYW